MKNHNLGITRINFSSPFYEFMSFLNLTKLNMNVPNSLH